MIFETDDRIDGDSASLPDTMACLLETAIDDARRLDRSIYVPHHDQWHQATNNNTCEVCLAGSMVAGTFEIPPSETVTSDSFDHRTENLLNALDDMRYGYWISAFCKVYDQEPTETLRDELKRIPVPDHGSFVRWDGFDSFLASLELIVPRLREIDQKALSL